MGQRCHLPLPKRGLPQGPGYKGAGGRGERRGAEERGGAAVSGAGPGGWDGMGWDEREGEGRETLAASPPVPAPSGLRWAGGGFPPTAIPRVWRRVFGGAQSLPPAAAIRLRCAPALGRAGISLGGRADSGQQARKPSLSQQPFPISLYLPALPHLPLF